MDIKTARLRHCNRKVLLSISSAGLMLFTLVGGCGAPATPLVPVLYEDLLDTIELMPRESAIEYLNTLPWGDVWGESCTFTEKGVISVTYPFNRKKLTPYEKVRCWATGPLPEDHYQADGSYHIRLKLSNVSSVYIAPPDPDGTAPPESAKRAVTALETLISQRTRKK